ncbi:hypothetical protein [Pseudogracilibacillus auburnensis]|uniref:hypothetical protein n=1 Tax=Pseudogracilibacillus auburnensis TaxID=1494959 RepID=UPI001A971CD9|nr:hypothetical protein [Pseudogracilibacillus auburnensis]MBO1005112.1 hypothetical protein [Pseudogracilibacillus auburnensis]
MPYIQTLNMSEEDQRHLLEWWNTTEAAKVVERHLVSLVSELRLLPEASHADGMVLFYRAVSEISYGYAGVRGCIRRSFTREYSHALRKNMVKCHSFAHKYAVDAKVLIEVIAKQVRGKDAVDLINRIRESLKKNDELLKEMAAKADVFYGTEALQSLQKEVEKSTALPM